MGRRLLIIVVAAAATAGCGGPIQRDELEGGVGTPDSIAGGGRPLAPGGGPRPAQATFVRVHARELAEDADHEAEKLADAEASGRVAELKAAAVSLAQDVSDAVGELEVFPGDEATGERAAGRLANLAREAKRLEEEL